jgi:uncharacterized protein
MFSIWVILCKMEIKILTGGFDYVIMCAIEPLTALPSRAQGQVGSAECTRVFFGFGSRLLMVRFDVSALTKARLGTSFTLNVNTGPQSLTDLEVDSLRGTVRLIRVQGGLFAQGTVESQLGLVCVRCLEPFNLPITLELEETFRLPGTSPRSDAPYGVGEDGWLDLTPVLREQCWLSIPMKPLCRPDCKGLCPQCGANLDLESCTCKELNVDPRLALLKELL